MSELLEQARSFDSSNLDPQKTTWAPLDEGRAIVKKDRQGSGKPMGGKLPSYMTTKSKPTKPKDRQTKKEEVEDINELTAAEKKLINMMYDKKGNLTPLGKKVMDHGKKVAVDKFPRNVSATQGKRMESKEEVEIQESGHTDVASAQTNVKVAMSALTKMSGELSKLNPEDALPSWWTNKVAVAVDKLDGMADYLDTQVEEVKLGERLDPADVDDDATDDDIKSADKNIMMQLRKSVSLRGNFPVEFMDKKKIRVPAKVAQAVQSKYNSLRKPNDKEKFQSQIAKSYKDMLGAIKEAVSPAQQAAIAISKKERGEKPKKESKFSTINKQLKGEK